MTLATMRQRASLDIIADRGAAIISHDQAIAVAEPASSEHGRQQASAQSDLVDLAVDAQDDARSTSSSSSPAPGDNNEESDFFLGANDSQSSLGVPNLQDMQVTDEDCLPPINQLPNEILIAIFSKLSSLHDVFNVMMTCRRWARNAVDILWHRPSCTTWGKHEQICHTLSRESQAFPYKDFIKRLNLACLHDSVNDGSIVPLASCTRVERLTLTNCAKITDTGLIPLIANNSHLLALDVSNDNQITEASIYAIAQHCKRLQGLNISGCHKVSPESMITLAENCRFLKRLKLNDCQQLTNEAVLAFAEHCPNILEIDLHQCKLIGNEPVTALIEKGQALRELRLVNCDLIDDNAFLSLPDKTFENLRILDLTSCDKLTDRAVQKIIQVAPRLRNLVFAKCRQLTDDALYAIAGLGKNLHFLHLGHCHQITDEAVKKLVAECNRIRYIDLGCCTHLTDDSVMKLATLPKLKRIGLVKCAQITDASIIALANANRRARLRKDTHGNVIPNEYVSTTHSSLERVHLSYCTNLTLKGILRLLKCCPRLTHLSLTGVAAFLREDLEAFSREPPPGFTQHQRDVFCVFSGQGVLNLRQYLNQEKTFAELGLSEPRGVNNADRDTPTGGIVQVNNGDADETEVDAVDEDDMDDADMAEADNTAQPVNTPAPQQPPPPPPVQPVNPFNYVQHPPYVPQAVLLQHVQTQIQATQYLHGAPVAAHLPALLAQEAQVVAPSPSPSAPSPTQALDATPVSPPGPTDGDGHGNPHDLA
ncbi:putative SCF E3 ubiquitin ligase complex F-box protein [Triangularia verruculosa]|uniref:SCF E3 ubiquitin ligase complex F-box protein n=1 Tax=Triangularia verruculosa TaxID=2587418 RepID=A0AAN6XEX8_9PEZI|nr:putative SCF E3 ubiquitin ligase complex F-box protein [Triangularia verruculosa]